MAVALFIVRTDADTRIGLGHLSRCLTLAQAIMAQGAVVEAAITDPAPAVAAKILAAGLGLAPLPPGLGQAADLDWLIDRIKRQGALGAILDGYQFTQAYLDGLAQAVCCLFFDELMAFDFKTALVLNQNFYARPVDYRRASGTELLLGPAYAVLRQEFTAARPTGGRSHPPTATRLFLNFGGSDPSDLTTRALQGLQGSARRYHIKVVLGAANPFAANVRAAAAAGPHQVDILTDIANMAEVMNWADLALSASGTTTLEMCCLGLPSVLVIQVENQRRIGEAMGARGLAVQLGWWEEVDGEMMRRAVDELAGDQDRRRDMSQAALTAVDGKGAARVAKALLARSQDWRP